MSDEEIRDQLLRHFGTGHDVTLFLRSGKRAQGAIVDVNDATVMLESAAVGCDEAYTYAEAAMVRIAAIDVIATGSDEPPEGD